MRGAEIKPDSKVIVNSARKSFQRLRFKNEQMIVKCGCQRVFGGGLSLTGDCVCLLR